MTKKLTKFEKERLIKRYVWRIQPHLELAKKAYGSRNTVSPQHAASREYTRLLVEFYEEGGSLLGMAEALGVTYAGLRRRVTTADLEPSSNRPRMKFPDDMYEKAVKEIMAAKAFNTHRYHETLKKYFDMGLSMSRIARMMGLSSANPLYYGVSQIRIQDQEDGTL